MYRQKRRERSGTSNVLRWSTLAVTVALAAGLGGPVGAAGAAQNPAAAAARQATVTLVDLGPGWSEYRAAGGSEKTSKKNCNVRFGALKLSDRGYAGPMFTDTAQQSYVYSYGFVFRSRAAAKAFTAGRRKAKFLRCQVASDDAAQKKSDAKTYVRMVAGTDPAVGENGLEAFYREEGGTRNDDGADVASADYVRYTFRHGRAVFIIVIDTGLAADEATRNELGTRLSAALSAGADGIESRLTALGL